MQGYSFYETNFAARLHMCFVTLELHAPLCGKISLVNIVNGGQEQTSNFPVTGIRLILLFGYRRY